LGFIAEKAAEDAPALIRPGGEAMSYATLAMASSAIMQALGERVGDVAHRIVGVAVDDGAGFIASVLAVLEAGGVVLPLDLRRGIAALELEAARARAVAVIVGDAAEDRLDVVAGDESRRALEAEACLLVDARGRRAVCSRAGLGIGVDAIVRQVGLDATSRLPLIGPLAHASVLTTALATLRAGGALLLVGALAPDEQARAMAELGANVLSGTMATLMPIAETPPPGITRVVAVGAREIEPLRARFASARISRALDTGEALRIAAAEDDGEWIALPAIELRHTLDAFEVQSATAMLRYLDDAEATAAASVELDGHRWLRAFDVDGVDAATLERAIARAPGVRQVAVLALRSGGAERLHAFVAGKTEAVQQHPARVVTLETLPHRADGSIDREALRRMVATD
jgi:hypothetical protein